MDTAPPIEIFRTGRHTAMGGQTLSFTEADLAASAAAYDPALHEAPIVIGHPATDGPAFGWVSALRVEGGRLQATPQQLDPAFAELVREGRYKKVSASFYGPDAPANPKPGVYYLRHVGFLGAQPPAVKGLRQVAFAGSDEGVVEFADPWAIGAIARLFRGLRDVLIGQVGQERTEAALPADTIAMLGEAAAADAAREAAAVPPPASPTPLSYEETRPMPEAPPGPDAAAAAELERLRAQVAAFAEAEAARRAADDAAFLDVLEREGRLLPATRPLAAGLLAALGSGEAVSFAEGRAAETPREALRAILAAQPRAVHFAEVAGGADAPALSEGATPEQIAAASLAYQERARARGVAVSNIEAVRAVTGGTR